MNLSVCPFFYQNFLTVIFAFQNVNVDFYKEEFKDIIFVLYILLEICHLNPDPWNRSAEIRNIGKSMNLLDF